MKEISIKIPPKDIENIDYIRNIISKKLRLGNNKKWAYKIHKRSLDARGNHPFFLLQVHVFPDGEIPVMDFTKTYLLESNPKTVIIVGAGPAGYFAALKCLEKGLKPIVLERGKMVRERRRDLRNIQQEGEVNPNSNYCFGEGGAGTYSDGKLYTRSHKRGKIQDVLEIFVAHGANEDILIDAHPHIGSNKLPQIVSNLRETIENNGGEVHFDTRVDDFIISNGRIKGVIASDKEYKGDAVILATGHSARDIFYLCDNPDILTEFKAFALGVRVEHPQALIDKIQYKQEKREANLPASSYSLVCQVKRKGVFSFCMCPGGMIVPSATAPGELVVNGMSLSRRDSEFANSGIVTSIDWDDLRDYHQFGKYAGLEFQKEVEQTFYSMGDGTQQSPAQRLPDFVSGTRSESIGETSYIPGVYSAPLHDLLPDFLYQRLRTAFILFGKKMEAYFTHEANIVGPESRTSSPIRIPRKKNYQSESIEGLYPTGEGAGYAGGILSAALDGQNVAKAIGEWLDE